MVDVDVVIVGGGPAGCSSALTLLARGFSVAVLARPDQREKPTETAAATLKQILRSLDAESALSACEPCYGIVSDWGRNTPVLQPSMLSPFGHAWFIHRARFNACLQKLARDRGADWIQSEAREADFVAEGVRVKATDISVKASWLTIANGFPSWAANITRQKPNNVDPLIAFWARLPTPMEERLLRIEVADFGWWYVCPGDGAGVFACCVTDVPNARATGIADVALWNDRFRVTDIFQQLGSAASANAINTVSASTASLPLKHGQHWVAVGDAAVKLDPLGSSGIITALDSGQRGAHAVADVLNGNAAGIQKYQLWSDGLAQTFTRQRRQHYTMEAQKRVDGFWSRRN